MTRLNKPLSISHPGYGRAELEEEIRSLRAFMGAMTTKSTMSKEAKEIALEVRRLEVKLDVHKLSTKS